MTDNYLSQRAVPWQVSADVPNAAGSVLLLGTTAPAAELLRNPEWTADLEYVWRTRMAGEVDRLNVRAKRNRTLARRLDPAGGLVDAPRYRIAALKRAEWAEERARAVAMSRVDVLNTCEQRWRTIACGCGRRDLRVACDQPQLCATCRKRHASKWRRRITEGMDDALRAERREYWNTPKHRRRGGVPGVYMITLTAPHTGDLESDRKRMGPAVRKLLKHAEKWGWWRTYALTWEATGGTRDDGHLHVHLCVISSWIPYTSEQAQGSEAWCPRRPGERRRRQRGLHEVWQHAVPGALHPHVSPPRRGTDEAANAGGYLAKYVTKGIEVAEFTGRKAGELLCAFRNRRKVSTSARFWRLRDVRCPCCMEWFRMVEAPSSLQDLAPGAVLRSMAERRRDTRGRPRVWVARGAPQVSVRWGSDNGHGEAN
jgi:hypothetical protein